MDLKEIYTSPERFPLTTQKGLTFLQQARIDAFNYDSYQEGMRNGYRMTKEDRQRFKELSDKMALFKKIQESEK